MPPGRPRCLVRVRVRVRVRARVRVRVRIRVRFRVRIRVRVRVRVGVRVSSPMLLDIFWPSRVHQPCAKRLLGSGRPAAWRKAGQ